MAKAPVRVNDEEISEARIEAEVQRLKGDYERQFGQSAGGVEDGKLRAVCIDNLIARCLLRWDAADVEVSEEELDAACKRTRASMPDAADGDPELRREVRRDLAVQKRLEALEAQLPEPSEDEIGTYYDAHAKQFAVPEQVHARHIVKHLDQGQDRAAAYVEMMNVWQQLNKGASFEELAGRLSSCPERGGDLGYFGRGQMVEAFENVVFNLGKGEISDVFETPFGYHIARVEDVRPAAVHPLEEVREDIVGHLREVRKMEAVRQRVEELKARAQIVRAD